MFLQQMIECDLHEDFEWSVARFSLRTQQCSLPAIQKKSSHQFRIRTGRQLFPRDCLLEDRRKRVLPVGKRGADLLSQLRIRRRNLQTEAAHHTSGNRSVLAIELHEIHEVLLQTLEWGHL